MRSRLLRVCVLAVLVATVSLGVGQLYAKKPAPNPCPLPAPGCFCTTEYAPVACAADGINCIYSNLCVAICAGFQPSQCVAIGPGPVIF